MLSKINKAILALIVANLIWGAASPIFKWSLHDVEPFTLAFLRFFLATLLILPFTYKNLRIDKKDYLTIFLIGLSGITINISFFFLGLQLAASINAPVIGSAAPILLMVTGAFVLKEKLTLKKVTGGLIGFLGILIIVLAPLLRTGLDSSLIGNIFLLIATAGGVWQVILLRKIAKKYSALTLVFWSFLVGAVTFYPLFLIDVYNVGFLPHLTPPAISGILFGALLCSMVAYWLFYWAIKYLPVADVGMFTYIDPVAAIVIAAPLLNEIPTTTYIIGSCCIFVGIFIAENRLAYHPFHKLRQPKLPFPNLAFAHSTDS